MPLFFGMVPTKKAFSTRSILVGFLVRCCQVRRSGYLIIYLDLLQKTVLKVVELTQVQCVFGGIDTNKLQSADYYVYFIKKKNQPIPLFSDIDETNLKMPSYFYIGSLGNNILNDMKLILDTVSSIILSIIRLICLSSKNYILCLIGFCTNFSKV